MAMVSAATSIIGGIVGAAGAQQQAEAQAASYEYNAAVAQRNQAVIHNQTKVAVEDQSIMNFREYRMVRAAYGNSGITFSGSAMDVAYDTRHEMRLRKERIKYGGRLKEIEMIDEYNLNMMGAQAARQAGQISAISSILGGIGGAASAIGSMA